MIPLTSAPTAAKLRSRLLLGTVVLLLVIASRTVQLGDIEMNPDEVWSVWQTYGTPQQIIEWTPYDWPPLYYLALGGWRGLVGEHPILLRLFSTLMFTLGAAFTFRAGKRLSGERAGWLAMLAYAALGFAIFLSLHVRGYALVLGLLPLALWLTMRYFDRPQFLRGVLLGVVLAAMFYTTLTVIMAFLMLGIYTLLVYGLRIWRWWLPGIIGGTLALPEILNKASTAINRTVATGTLQLPPLPQAIWQLLERFAGTFFPLWIVLGVLALLLLILRRERGGMRQIAVLIWALLMPIVLYLLNPLLGFFSTHYGWWLLLGIALLVGCGLTLLPRAGVVGAGVLLAGLLFVPIPIDRYEIIPSPPLAQNMAWLTDFYRPGDVLLVDPHADCAPPEEWDYYTRVFFPHGGLHFVTNATGYRRVWYVVTNGWQDAQFEAQVTQGRIPGRFVGPPGCLFRVYEAPPDVQGVLFENGMRFHGMDILEGDQPYLGVLARREGESVRVRLWWSVDAPIALNYSVGLQIQRSGAVLTQSDSAPQLTYPPGATGETSTWTPGQYYIEERTVQLPYPINVGYYPLYLVVYEWQSQQRFTAPGANDSNLLLLAQLYVRAW